MGPDGHLIPCSGLFSCHSEKMARPGALLVVMMCCACSLYLYIYLGIERIPDLLLVLVAVVGGGEQGWGVMTFVVFAGNPCYGEER